jgi:hypothetical protein
MAFDIESQQPGKRFLFVNVGGLAIGGVEVAMGVVEPGRALVVKVGQGAGLEGRGGLGFFGTMRSG